LDKNHQRIFVTKVSWQAANDV